ncbi:hypothetical protein H8D57_00480 [bacterium]|nr:hypothetical protein [bacterium]
MLNKSSKIKLSKFILLTVLSAFFILDFTGCETAIIPRDLKDFVSHDLKVERRRIELTQPFRTKITFRTNPMTIAEARIAEKDLVTSCIKYYRRDGINNFINDTLVYVVRMDSDPGTNIKWWTVSDDMRMVLKGDLSTEEFINRIRKEENWKRED